MTITTVAGLISGGFVPRHPCVASTEPDGMHPFVDFDPTKRAKERFLELVEGREENPVHVRTSPDITHMFIGPDGWAPIHVKIRLTCDESLPPNSIIIDESETAVRRMYKKLAEDYRKQPKVPDLGGGAPGDRYPF